MFRAHILLKPWQFYTTTTESVFLATFRMPDNQWLTYWLRYRGILWIQFILEKESRDKRLGDLKELFLARNYSEQMIDSAVTRAKCIPRESALRKSKINEKQRGQYLLSGMTLVCQQSKIFKLNTGDQWLVQINIWRKYFQSTDGFQATRKFKTISNQSYLFESIKLWYLTPLNPLSVRPAGKITLRRS